MPSKGAGWMWLAIGVILVVNFLIVSFYFSKTTILQREVVDANVVFEGDELETYTRSIQGALELSIPQALYDFYAANYMGDWQTYGSVSVPELDGFAEGRVQEYFGKFLEKHRSAEFNEQPSVGISGADSVDLTVEYGVTKASAGKIELTKTADTASYRRSFVPEAALKSSFGLMYYIAKDYLIGGDMVGKYAVNAISEQSKKLTLSQMTKCSVSFVHSDDSETNILHSYIDENTRCTDPAGAEPGNGGCFKTGQTTTKGKLEYCNKRESDVTYVCAKSNPCPNFNPKYNPDPSVEEVYTRTHGPTMGSGQGTIEGYAHDRLLCLESEIDSISADYTFAFDGGNERESITDSRKPADRKLAIEKKSLISGSCQEPVPIGKCDGEPKGSCDDPMNPIRWKCYEKRKIICDYGHFSAARVGVRVQENGFVYSLYDDSSAKGGKATVQDTLKMVFRVTSGNSEGLV